MHWPGPGCQALAAWQRSVRCLAAA